MDQVRQSKFQIHLQQPQKETLLEPLGKGKEYCTISKLAKHLGIVARFCDFIHVHFVFVYVILYELFFLFRY